KGRILSAKILPEETIMETEAITQNHNVELPQISSLGNSELALRWMAGRMKTTPTLLFTRTEYLTTSVVGGMVSRAANHGQWNDIPSMVVDASLGYLGGKSLTGIPTWLNTVVEGEK